MEKRFVGRRIELRAEWLSPILSFFLVSQMRELVAMESVVALTVFAYFDRSCLLLLVHL